MIHIYIYMYLYSSKSLDVVQSLYFGSKLPSSGTYKYLPDESILLPKYRACTTSNDFELYLMCSGVMLLPLIIYIYIYKSNYMLVYIYT